MVCPRLIHMEEKIIIPSNESPTGAQVVAAWPFTDFLRLLEDSLQSEDISLSRRRFSYGEIDRDSISVRRSYSDVSNQSSDTVLGRIFYERDIDVVRDFNPTEVIFVGGKPYISEESLLEKLEDVNYGRETFQMSTFYGATVSFRGKQGEYGLVITPRRSSPSISEASESMGVNLEVREDICDHRSFYATEDIFNPKKASEIIMRFIKGHKTTKKP